jgi:protein phosphatase PTC7
VGEENVHDIKHRDILVLASDGLWDNLFNEKIIELIKPFVDANGDIPNPTMVAETIAKEAEKYSNQKGYFSPFGKNAEEYGYSYGGGKPDDITVVVA